MAEYAMVFRMLTAGSEWNKLALKAAFRQGFNPEVLACRDEEVSLNSPIDLTIHLDYLICNRQAYWGTASPISETNHS